MGLVKKPVRAGHPDLALLHQELSQLIGRLVEFDRADRAGLGDWLPSVDVFECRGTLTVVVEVPGLAPDSLRVACSNGQLVVSGERRERRAPGAAAFLCMERPHGRFTRTILLAGRRAAGRRPPARRHPDDHASTPEGSAGPRGRHRRQPGRGTVSAR